MAPLIKEFQLHKKEFTTRICVTAQHREMLDQVLNFFEIVPDYDLNLMKPNQDLFTLTSDILLGLKPILQEFKPDYVYVHGDTTTSMAAALSAFYVGSKVCHVEAGLRTNNKLSPFPEELNRQITSRIADFHFAPTGSSKKNLIKENISEENILVTGNTVIDALLYSRDKLKTFENEEIAYLKSIINLSKRIILVTGHRRENFGDGFINICAALKEIAESNPSVQIIYPVHLNPHVEEPVYKILGKITNIHLIKPLAYPAFVWLMTKSYLIITDSGGVQEEAPSLGKPVLVMRGTTERPEAVESGTAMLVGTDRERIVRECNTLLKNEAVYHEMSKLNNPYGDGNASQIIIDKLLLSQEYSI